MLVCHFRELLQCLGRLLELVGKLCVLLVLPRVAERGETRLQCGNFRLEIGVEPFQLLGESPDFFGINNGLRHDIFIPSPASSGKS